MINDIKESLCSFELSELLKQKGFRCLTMTAYDTNKTLMTNNSQANNWTGWISAPTHDLVKDWIHVNFNIWIYVKKKWNDGNFVGYESIIELSDEIKKCGVFESPEQATEEALLFTTKKLLIKSESPVESSIKNISLKLFTEEEVSKLLTTQRGNCYVAILSKTKDQELAKVAAMAPEPWNWNDREK